MQTILLTGGAGYIGTHIAVALLEAGHAVVVADNFSNSRAEALEGVKAITGTMPAFYKTDLRDGAALAGVFEQHEINAVIHLAGLKAVGESGAQPLAYYDNNIGGTITLCRLMMRHGVKNLVFSSSATVYGEPKMLPIAETADLKPTNPYGRTKMMIENMLRDLYAADAAWNISILRYFNPAGAHESGRIGEAPQGIPNNLMPFIVQVAAGQRPRLQVFGDDYPTADGSGIRDYIHVADLADGHLKALQKLDEQPGLIIHNLGAGRGYSVLEVIKSFEAATGRQIPYQIAARRPGDVAVSYTDCRLANAELGWRAERDINCICQDAWRWAATLANDNEQ